MSRGRPRSAVTIEGIRTCAMARMANGLPFTAADLAVDLEVSRATIIRRLADARVGILSLVRSADRRCSGAMKQLAPTNPGPTKTAGRDVRRLRRIDAARRRLRVLAGHRSRLRSVCPPSRCQVPCFWPVAQATPEPAPDRIAA